MLDKLPLELLLQLYSYLSHSDKKSLCLTCRNCYRATFALSVMKDDILHIDTRVLKDSCKNVKDVLKNSDRYYDHITIKSLTVENYTWALEKFGQYVKTLTFTDCDVNFQTLITTLSDASYLEKLRFISCNLLLSESSQLTEKIQFNNLSTLEISRTIYLTDFILSKFIELCPNLINLRIGSTTLNFHRGIHSFNYGSNIDTLQNPSSNVFTIQYLRALLTSRSTIKGLDLSHTLINAYALSDILSCGLQLNYLNLNHCRELRRINPIYIGEFQPLITELHLASCDFVTNDCLENICETLPNLRVLDISGIYAFDDDGFIHLKRLHFLEEFNFSYCSNVSGMAIRAILTDRSVTAHMKVLRMSGTLVDSYDFVYILCYLNLIELDISYCKNLHNSILNTLFISQRNLRRLNMANILITDEGVTNYAKYLLNLPNINLEKYEYEDIMLDINQSELFEESKIYYQLNTLNYTYYKIEKLCNLTSLDLSKCSFLTDYFMTIPLRLPNLRKLSLAGIKNISTKAIMLIVHGCPAIEVLDLTSTSVDDYGVCVLVMKLYRLKILSLKECKKITNRSLTFIQRRCKHLQKLYIHGCLNLNDKIIQELKMAQSVIDVIGKPIRGANYDYTVPNPPPLPFPVYF